jgi:hypothetical protein
LRLKKANSSADDDGMTLPFMRRTAPRPVLVSLTNRWAVCPDGQVRRECLVRLPDGELALRPVSDARLVALGAVAA